MASAEPTFSRYELLGTLGPGGFGTVYRARDRVLEREVALKVLHDRDARAKARFLSEARRIARLRHPNIVTIYAVGEEDDVPFFTIEVVEGKTLADLTPPGTQHPLDYVSRILTELAGAVDYMHSRGVVHRDIKAANIMLEDVGRVVLMDFGIARVLDQTSSTSIGLVFGTPEYMAPEQWLGGAVGPPADVYAVGVLAYRLLAGRPPFEGELPSVMYGHVHEQPPSLRGHRPGLPEGVYEAIGAALSKDHAARPATVAALARAIAAPDKQPVMAPAAPSSRRRILVAVVAGAAGERIRAWRQQRDPRQARRLPPHATLCYWAPAVDPGLLERQVRHAFARGASVRLGGVGVFDNDDRTVYVALEEAAQLDEARRRLYDGKFLALPGSHEWTWHVTCVRRSRGRDLEPLLQAARTLASLGPWRIDRVAYMELRGERYETIASYRLF